MVAAAKPENPLQSLTVHLLKHCSYATDALKSQSGLARQELEGVGTLFIKPPKPKPPTWSKFFEPRVSAASFGRVASLGAVLFVSVDDHHFAVTFGTGRYLLDPIKLEQRFGLLVALNTIDEDRVRSIDKQSFDRLATQSRVQASHEAKPSDFGLDIEQDLLRAVTGSPRGGAPGESVSGLDALHVIGRIRLDDLRSQLSSYLKKYGERRYRRAFPWVDQISPGGHFKIPHPWPGQNPPPLRPG